MDSELEENNLSGKCIELPLLGSLPLEPSVIFAQLKLKDGPLWAQLFKFGVCGGVTFVLFMLGYASFELFMPEYMSTDLDVDVRQKNLMFVMIICFIPTNLITFWLNRKFVFGSGKHGIGREFFAFSLLAALSFIGGEWGKTVVVDRGYSNILAVLVFAVASAIINFIARRVFIFTD